MQKVSELWKKEMANRIRGRSYMRINFGLVDVDAADDMSAADNGHEFLSEVSKISRYNQEYSYATAENNGFLLNGRQRIVPESQGTILYQGFVSNTLSDQYGYFNPQPYITMNFTKTHRTKGLSFIFDHIMQRYPSEIEITAYRQNNIIFTKKYEVDSFNYIAYGDFEYFDSMRIKFIRWFKPFQRARLSNIVFGVGIIFDNRNIINATQTEDIDPIMRRLPINTFSFNILNLDKSYNPDNPNGIWSYVEEKSPITISYGLQLTEPISWGDLKDQKWGDLELVTWGDLVRGDYIEWIDNGSYILDAIPIADGIQVTFNCTDLIGGLTETYFENNGLNVRSLYDLAENVLKNAKLTEQQYYISDILKEISTNAPLTDYSFKDSLKIIAQAAFCILFTDLEGIIHIEPNAFTKNDFKLTLDDMWNSPKIEKSPLLKNIEGKVYEYYFDEEKQEIESNETVYNFEFNETGITEKIENPLITSYDHLLSVVSQYAHYLNMRNTYYYDYRGNPELESNDIISMQSDFSDDLKVITLKHVISFTGGIRGNLITKRLEGDI